ncbi:MAG: DUF3021 domain-containing protein [Lachnospiraceae bacterium]|nr:DUF3021 domain-containing protein [Lachnospiraceae bacterium]
MIAKIKEMLHTFSYVVTGVVFMCALFLTAFNQEGIIHIKLFWQILFASFLCVLGNLIYPQRKVARWQVTVRRMLHYLYVNIVVFGCARAFWWFDVADLEKTGFLFLEIAVVFFVVSWVMWHKSKTLSDLLNDHLEKYQNKMPRE